MTDDVVTRDRLRRILAAHPFTRGLAPGEVEALAELASLTDFEAGVQIFDAGEPAETFYLVVSGLVTLEVDTGAVLTRTIQQIAEGSALGWSWLFPPYVWQFAAVAKSPVRTISFDAEALRNHFVSNPSCGYQVLAKVAEVMADRLHATRRQVINLVG